MKFNFKTVSEEGKGDLLIQPLINEKETIIKQLDSVDGDYFDLPISFDLLTGFYLMNSAHSSCVKRKVAMVCAGYFGKKDRLSLEMLERIVLDFVLFGNFYLIKNEKTYKHVNARIFRKCNDGAVNTYYKVLGQEILSEKMELLHGRDYTPHSTYYGLPDYLSCLNAIWLAYQSCQSRNKVYENGTRGGVFITNLPNEQKEDENGVLQDSEDFKAFREALIKTKGIGNGKTVHVNVDNSEIKDVKNLIYFAELGGKLTDDGFDETMNQCRISVINAHGLHPELVGLVGDQKSSPNFDRLLDLTQKTVIDPIRATIADVVNTDAGEEVVKFEKS